MTPKPEYIAMLISMNGFPIGSMNGFPIGMVFGFCMTKEDHFFINKHTKHNK